LTYCATSRCTKSIKLLGNQPFGVNELFKVERAVAYSEMHREKDISSLIEKMVKIAPLVTECILDQREVLCFVGIFSNTQGGESMLHNFNNLKTLFNFH
jgi:hypothetical protein